MTIPKITVITISYNSSATIEATLKSVTAQDYANMEYVVIDGGSTDGTQSIIDRYRERISFYVSEPDRGISDAFNKGIAHSTGDIIVCINSDDQLLPGALEKVAAYYDGETDIYSCDLLLLNTKTGEKRIQHPSTHFPLMPFFRRPGHQGVFVTRQAYERLGGYNTSLHYTMDLDLLMRATSAGLRFKHVPVQVSVFRLGGATNESIFKKRQEYVALIRGNGGSWLQAYTFYGFLVCTQTIKKALRLTGIDWIRKIRYRKEDAA